MKRDQSTLNGVILVDKPTGMTSHDVVNRMRRVAGTRQVGHTGTLDPLADGLLMICIGRATRISQFLLGLNKTYVGTIRLGAISSTYDAEGKITEQGRPVPVEAEAVRAAMQAQIGEIIQQPPPYSAVKVEGRKLYEYARAGEEIPRKSRRVRVYRFELIRFAPPEIHFQAKVGSGTYIRSMAHDLGIHLECGAYLSQLRRTEIGGYSVERALPLETLIAEPLLCKAHLMSISETLSHMPKITIQARMEEAILNGRPFTTRDILESDGLLSPGESVLVLGPGGRVLSVARGEPLASDNEGHADRDEDAFVLGVTQMLFKPVRVLGGPD